MFTLVVICATFATYSFRCAGFWAVYVFQVMRNAGAFNTLFVQDTRHAHQEFQRSFCRCETGFILLLLVSVDKVPFLILVSVCTWCPFGGTRNIYPTSCEERMLLCSGLFLKKLCTPECNSESAGCGGCEQVWGSPCCLPCFVKQGVP